MISATVLFFPLQMTGLRGGRLLFHLQKLTKAGIIMQKHERGVT
jgi:hypothetical protein